MQGEGADSDSGGSHSSSQARARSETAVFDRPGADEALSEFSRSASREVLSQETGDSCNVVDYPMTTEDAETKDTETKDTETEDTKTEDTDTDNADCDLALSKALIPLGGDTVSEEFVTNPDLEVRYLATADNDPLRYCQEKSEVAEL